MIIEIWEKNWKAFLAVPLIMFILSIGYFIRNASLYDSPVKRSVELEGGKEITISVLGLDQEKTQQIDRFASENRYEYRIIGGNTIVLSVPYIANDTEIIKSLEFLGIEDYSVRTVGPSLGQKFWSQTVLALLASLAIISIMVFILFRSFVPSFAVVSSIIIDVSVTTAIVSALGYEFSIAMLGALLTIMSYSIDTDVLLTTKLTKHDSDFRTSVKEALKTGIIITVAALVSAVTVLVLSTNQVLKDISIVLTVGLVVDFITTWFQNAGIIKWWVDGKSRKTD